jgi:tetratricopeptide (TPR) repeat protein
VSVHHPDGISAGDSALDAEATDAEAALAAERGAADDWYRLAGVRRRQARMVGDLDAAEKHLRAALCLYVTMDDRYDAGRVLVELAEISLAAGDYLTAAELASQAAERIPGDTAALTVLGYGEWLAGSIADAEVTFGRALYWDADAAAALVGRGQVRADLGDYAAALDDLNQALKHELDRGTEADARSARALALAALGRAADAVEDLAESRRLDPGRSRTQQRADHIAALTVSRTGGSAVRS